MADPTFPPSLPVCRMDGYGYQYTSAFTRTDMDGGLARQRRRFVSTPAAVTATWRLTRDQLGTFESFVLHDLQAGVAWFTVRLPNGQGLTSVRARLTEPYQVASAGRPDLFDVSCKLETLSFPVAS